jgi:uroporphyrinogen decarboxylase
MSLFRDAVAGKNNGYPPIWMMRQAGRYHSHYRAMKEKYSFLDLCRNPDLACEVTMGPINDFDFDAAILFSDILFPLNVLGTPLDFAPSPQLGFLLNSIGDLKRYTTDPDISQLDFQTRALSQIRAELPKDKGLIGFVGGMMTLYVFAVHGTHKTDLTSARDGFKDGRFEGFMQHIFPVMLENMVLQASENIDALAIFESCAGDIDLDTFGNLYLPYLRDLLTQFKNRCPNTEIIYYAKGVGDDYWKLLRGLPIRVLGIDYNQNLSLTLQNWSDAFSIQGNFDPRHLTLDPDACEEKILDYFHTLYAVSDPFMSHYICGTGHGLVPEVREENVKKFIQLSREMWHNS